MLVSNLKLVVSSGNLKAMFKPKPIQSPIRLRVAVAVVPLGRFSVYVDLYCVAAPFGKEAPGNTAVSIHLTELSKFVFKLFPA